MDETIQQMRISLKENILYNQNNCTEHVNEKQQLCDLIKRTIEVGESNSALVIGPRSTGKTTLMNEVLEDIKKLKDFKVNSLLVHLNGLIHTDDRLALIAITNQMHLDNAVDGKVFGSFAENLAFLLACLRTGNRNTTKSVVFIIEEFDLFCFHNNQTLLYNLFDISQSAQTPICIIGVTSRLDVIELFEKRVKSRFSHRQYFILPAQDTNEHSLLDSKLQRLQNMLKIKDKSIKDATLVRKWNANIEAFNGNKQFSAVMQRLIDIDLNETILRNMLLEIVASLNEEKCEISVEDFEKHLRLFESDEFVEQLLDLSVLELCLIISMKHHVDIYDTQPFNFEMIFTRYIKFANSNSGIQNVQRAVLMKSFEHLHQIGFIQPITMNSNRLQKEYEMYKLLVTAKQILEAIKKYQGLPTEILQWAKSSLI